MDKATRWGDLESEEEESEDEEEEEEEEEEDTESLADGITSIASGYNSSLPSGIETPEVIDLRKGKPGARMPTSLLSHVVTSIGNRQCYATIMGQGVFAPSDPLVQDVLAHAPVLVMTIPGWGCPVQAATCKQQQRTSRVCLVHEVDVP